MSRYFIQLSYDGTNYHGWQIQQNARSIQEETEKALSVLCREKIEVTGAGRTDTGVHATYYIAHFECNTPISDPEQFLFKLNCLLPADIASQRIFPVPDQAHARFDATYREYNYFITRKKDPFQFRTAEKESRTLDVPKMNEAAATLFDYEDFTSFSKVGSNAKTNICKIHKAYWTEKEDVLIFTIRADRFLRNMVRAIVGTLLEVGLGRIDLQQFCRIIEKKDRSSAGASVPAKGLFLVDIGYPESIIPNIPRRQSL